MACMKQSRPEERERVSEFKDRGVGGASCILCNQTEQSYMRGRVGPELEQRGSAAVYSAAQVVHCVV